jgi:hypothetical protein
MRNHGKTFSLLMSVCFIAATATAFAQSGKCSFQKLSFPAAGYKRHSGRTQ